MSLRVSTNWRAEAVFKYMKKVLVDTDILIDYSHGFDRQLGKMLADQNRGRLGLYLSVVNVTEFMSDRKLKSAKLMGKAKEFISNFICQDVTKKVSLLAVQYLREGKTDFLGDALVAATVVVNNLELATRNRKHFSQIPGIKYYSL